MSGHFGVLIKSALILSSIESTISFPPPIIHLNIDNNEKQSPNPTEASNKLGGSLSPEYLSKEFPKQYGDSKQESQKHPATQLQEILNLFGEECWELFEISDIGRLKMLFFKRRKIID